MAENNVVEYFTEDDMALLWGATQVQLYASAIDEPDGPTTDRLKRLEALGTRLLTDMRQRWGKTTLRRPLDHQYRPTLGNPTRCVVNTDVGACNQGPDLHTTGGTLADANAANQVARRQNISRTTVDRRNQ
jgi:hypothetical protein